ncbi:uncharacterized protein F5147DRAFT_725078 [Suillus discolor]|uniref:Uncharacterized protein n=1 Tax=Suillus discolor TaxID=1912936 RepID=A0A9P7JML1_9AGAM|nr:uncharacterized protein F5147DRAFT_725078 [Suillus discolor]KAG2090107.1 hypothetical protein F5147DRAFT_725078 [Suillus discolor]
MVGQHSCAQSVVVVWVNCLSVEGQLLGAVVVHAPQSSDGTEQAVSHADFCVPHCFVSAAYEVWTVFESQVRLHVAVGSAFVQSPSRTFTPEVPSAHGAGQQSLAHDFLMTSLQGFEGGSGQHDLESVVEVHLYAQSVAAICANCSSAGGHSLGAAVVHAPQSSDGIEQVSCAPHRFVSAAAHEVLFSV